MSRFAPFLAGSALVLGACTNPDPVTPPTVVAPEGLAASPAAASSGLVVRSIPDEDPGPPFYARVGLQFFHDGGLLAIPFYRNPSCVPADFDLMRFFHFPGPGGPGAFACPLTMTGNLLIEPDAPRGTFPRQVVLEGNEVPFRFVDSQAFEEEAADGRVTMGDLATLSPLRGTATRYHETLRPREDEHKIIIDAAGTLEDGRRFRFHATHLGDTPRVVRIEIR